MSSYHSRFQADPFPRKGCKHKDRVRHSLLMTGFDDHWTKIDSCGPGRACNSSYCLDCRRKNVRAQSSKIVKLHRELHKDDDEARGNMRFVTVLCELCEPTLPAVRDALRRAKQQLNTLRRRKSLPGLWFFGRFELEAIDVERTLRLQSCPRKVATIRELNGGRDEAYGNDMVLVHFHAIMFLNGHDQELAREKLKNRWPTSYAISIKKLYDQNSMEDNIKKVCSYNLKDRYTYNYKMDTDTYRDGNYIKDGSLSFLIRSSTILHDDMLIYSKLRV